MTPPDAPFRIVEVDPAKKLATEAMGTKDKYWIRHPELGTVLFKAARPGTGEDWAERVAAEIAALLALPHADYELAQADGVNGTVSISFVPPEMDLVHGNELLVRIDPDYPSSQRAPAQYTVARVMHAVAKRMTLGLDDQRRSGIQNPETMMVGYLLLDAIIGNTDRHHENWAALRPTTVEDLLILAPTFDHASSLGRNEVEASMQRRLDTRDRQDTVAAYATRGRSPFVDDGGRRLSPLDVFRVASNLQPDSWRLWSGRLGMLSEEVVQAIVDRVPGHRMSSTARAFAMSLVRHNLNQLRTSTGLAL